MSFPRVLGATTTSCAKVSFNGGRFLDQLHLACERNPSLDIFVNIFDSKVNIEEPMKTCFGRNATRPRCLRRIFFIEGHKATFWRSQLTPNTVNEYEYLFSFDNDVDVGDFDLYTSIHLMKASRASIGQPRVRVAEGHGACSANASASKQLTKDPFAAASHVVSNKVQRVPRTEAVPHGLHKDSGSQRTYRGPTRPPAHGRRLFSTRPGFEHLFAALLHSNPLSPEQCRVQELTYVENQVPIFTRNAWEQVVYGKLLMNLDMHYFRDSNWGISETWCSLTNFYLHSHHGGACAILDTVITTINGCTIESLNKDLYGAHGVRTRNVTDQFFSNHHLLRKFYHQGHVDGIRRKRCLYESRNMSAFVPFPFLPQFTQGPIPYKGQWKTGVAAFRKPPTDLLLRVARSESMFVLLGTKTENFSAIAARDCLRHQRIVFAGDSYHVQTFFGLADILSGTPSQTDLVNGDGRYELMLKRNEQLKELGFGNVQFADACYTPCHLQMFEDAPAVGSGSLNPCARCLRTHYSNASATILSAGIHIINRQQGARMGQTTLVAGAIRDIESLLRQVRNPLWVTGPAYNHRSIPWPYNETMGEAITNTDLLYVKTIGLDGFAAQMKIPVLDVHEMTRACSWKNCSADGGHYSAFVNRMKAQMILGRLCKKRDQTLSGQQRQPKEVVSAHHGIKSAPKHIRPFATTLHEALPSSHYSRSTETAQVEPLQCGVLWYLHIGKTGGTSMVQFFQEIAASTKGSNTRWLFANLYSYPTCNQPLKSTNMSDWEGSDVWRRALTELNHLHPRLIVHQHHCSPGFGAYVLPQLRRIQLSLKKRGCPLIFATALRGAASRMTSDIYWDLSQWKGQHHSQPPYWSANGGLNRSRLYNWMRQQSDMQTKYLVYGSRSFWTPDLRNHVATPQLLDKAQRTLSAFGVIGRTENLTAFAARVAEVIGVTAPPLHGRAQIDHPFQLSFEDMDMIRLNNLGDEQLISRLPAADVAVNGGVHS